MGADAAKIAELKQKRKETQEEMYADQKSLGEATDASGNAIVVLGKHNSLSQVKAVAHRLLDSRILHMVDNSKNMGKARTDELRAFLNKAETATSFLAIPGMQSYAPQSGQIFG